jgi:K+/H+ antiporter YhaU regulatory subunit KhtT
MANGRTPEQAEKQLALLAAENRRLAAELEALQTQSVVLEKATRESRTGQATAEKEAAVVKRKLETLEKQSAETLQANKTLTAQVARLSKQVEKSPLNPLTVEEGSALFDRVIGAFRTSTTLELKQASLNLKLATAKLGDTAVLVLPDPKSVDPATLHELRIDLTSPVAAELPSVAAELSSEVAPLRTRVLRPTASRIAKRAAKAPARKRR